MARSNSKRSSSSTRSPSRLPSGPPSNLQVIERARRLAEELLETLNQLAPGRTDAAIVGRQNPEDDDEDPTRRAR